LGNFAIFGGSFDPVHKCHEEAVKLCFRELDIDRLFIVPTFINPFKDNYNAPPQKRYEWLQKVFSKYSDVEVLDVEIKKQRRVFTIETVEELIAKGGKQSYDKIYLIIGSDNLLDLPKWHRSEELLSLVTPIVISRDGGVKSEYKTIFLDCPFSSTDFRNTLNGDMLPSEIRDDAVSFYSKRKNI
jgi:nicotinate-nucleotide adenylyltransferase